MTAATTTQVTGRVAFPNDVSVIGGQVEFLLTSYDTDAGSDVTIVHDAVLADIDASGDIDISLWPNGDGSRGTQYRVTVIVPNIPRAKRIALGSITVPETGPVDLNDLLDAGPATFATEDIMAVGPGTAGVDRIAALQAAFAYTIANKIKLIVRGDQQVTGENGSLTPNGECNCEFIDASLTWIGSDVTTLTEVLENPTGTTELEGSGNYVLFDTKGCTGSAFSGSLTVIGSTPGGMTLAQAANIPANLVGITCSDGTSARLTWDKLIIQGCGFALWQGDQRGSGQTVLPTTRWTGKELRIQFCLTPLADGNNGNGWNEFRFANYDIARSGPVEIRSDWGGGPLFIKGPRFDADVDVETQTLAITAGSTSATLSAELDALSVGDVIAIEGGNDNLDDTDVLSHTTRVSAISGTAVTLETAPMNTDASARFIVVRTGVLASSASFFPEMVYLEGQTNYGILVRDGGKVSKNVIIEVSNGEYGARNNAAVNIVGITATELTATLHQRSGPTNTNLRTFAAVATLFDGTNYGEGSINITAQNPKADFTKFSLISGVRAESDLDVTYSSNPGVPAALRNDRVSYPDGVQWYQVLNHGPALEGRLHTATSYPSVGANLRTSGETDMTSVTGTGTCGAPSLGVVTKAAGAAHGTRASARARLASGC
jgi:hypothetical protein